MAGLQCCKNSVHAVLNTAVGTPPVLRQEFTSKIQLRTVQDGESWNRAIKPKALGAWNLHELSQSADSLEQFVVFSSVVSSIGHQGAPCKSLLPS